MLHKAALLILDGWGIGKLPQSDAILQAETSFYDQLWSQYPHSTLTTHGLAVGLPEGQMGNSEVGHLNLGAGRIVYQDLAWISQSMTSHSIQNLQSFKDMNSLIQDRDLHLIGLVSDGGVHSHIDHLKFFIDHFNKLSISKKIYLHIITDGRDTDPKSGLHFIKNIEDYIYDKSVVISSIIGRYFAMDRDHRWERIASAYNLLCHGTGSIYKSASEALNFNYDKNITDEFIPASKIGNNQDGLIKDGDAVFCFNFRTDRLRELTQVLSQEPVIEQQLFPLKLNYITLTRYDHSFRNIHVLFDKKDITNTIGEVLSTYGCSQLRIAETEKYPHVSFFFSGGRESMFTGEDRTLVPSPKVATYDLKPQMSAPELTDALLEKLEKNKYDFICLNFANTDMVGHTGVFDAVVIAAQTVDQCLSRIIPKLLASDYQILILADHGNADYMINEDGTPNTAHTKNPVPCIFIANDASYSLDNGKLADIAPTILSLMRLPIPIEMDGNILLKNKNF